MKNKEKTKVWWLYSSELFIEVDHKVQSYQQWYISFVTLFNICFHLQEGMVALL